MPIINNIINKIISFFKQGKRTDIGLTEAELAEHNERLTALHEAAHVVTTYLSEYHFLTGEVSLQSAITGETFVALSTTKLQSKQKFSSDAMRDPEVVKDVAVIFYAGFEAEKIYCDRYKSVPLNDYYSQNDFNAVDELIRNSHDPTINKTLLKEKSKGIIIEHWLLIWETSQQLIQSDNKSIYSYDLTGALNAYFQSKRQ
jgi:hypothetical protein